MRSILGRTDLIPEGHKYIKPLNLYSAKDSFDRGARSTESIPIENITAKFVIFDDFVEVYFNGDKYTISKEDYERLRYDRKAQSTIESFKEVLEQTPYYTEQ
jgi:hypothetical protein